MRNTKTIISNIEGQSGQKYVTIQTDDFLLTNFLFCFAEITDLLIYNSQKLISFVIFNAIGIKLNVK